MLKIIKSLVPFFEDCYRRINVREYAALIDVSPPTASKMLETFYTEGLLEKEPFRNYIFYVANKENSIFRDLARMYWREKLQPLLKSYENAFAIVLFGSCSKAEVTPDSDIDIVILGSVTKKDHSFIEKKLKRDINIIRYSSLDKIKSMELQRNVMNGYILTGVIR